MKMRFPTSHLRSAHYACAVLAAVLSSVSVFADELEQLKLLPPYTPLPPTFWQQYGSIIIVAGSAALLLIAILVWFLLRPRRKAVVPAETQARRELQPLLDKPENGIVLSKVSQILRHYMIAAFELSPAELTTTEFCRAISEHDRIGPELANATSQFLRQCDERKFSPNASSEPLGAARRAMDLIALGEARRASARQNVNA